MCLLLQPFLTICLLHSETIGFDLKAISKRDAPMKRSVPFVFGKWAAYISRPNEKRILPPDFL